MGKKRAVSVKRIGETLMKLHPNSFASDFEENKRIISEMMQFPSRLSRNKVAGYITRVAQSTDSESAEENQAEETLDKTEASEAQA